MRAALGRRGLRVQQGLPVRLVPPALPVLPVLTARSDLPVPKDRKGPPERVVAKVSPDLKAPQGQPVPKAQQGPPELKEPQVLTERQEQTVRLALKVYRVQMARTARTVLSVHRVTRGWRVRLGRRVIRVQMVP